MPYRAALDWLNFFLADVRGGLGPYVSVFLLTEAQWNQAQIGADCQRADRHFPAHPDRRIH